MGMNTPKGTSMDYKNFTPTYSYRHILADEMNLGADEYWTPKVLQTHLKIKKFYGAMYDEMTRSVGSPENYVLLELLDKVVEIKTKIGMWAIELDKGHYRRRNLIRIYSEWEYVEDANFEGIPYALWLYQGVMIVLPSKETIEWLNELAYLYCVSNKETV